MLMPAGPSAENITVNICQGRGRLTESVSFLNGFEFISD